MRSFFAGCLVILVLGALSQASAADRAYVVNNLSNDVSVIDLQRRAETARISVGSAPGDVAISPNRAVAYVTNTFDDTISVIDTRENRVIVTIPLEACTRQDSCRPTAVAFLPDSERAYITHARSPGCTVARCPAIVSVIDVTRHQLLTTVEMSFEAAYGIAVTPDGRFAYVTGYQFGLDRYDLHIEAIDTRTNTRQAEVIDFGLAHDASFGLGAIPPPFLPRTDIVITPDGALAYVSDGWSNSITRMDLGTTARVPRYLGEEEAIDSLALTEDGASLVVTRPNCVPLTVCQTGGAILRVQTSGNTAPLNLAGNGPSGVVIDGSIAYVTNLYDNAVSVFDLTSNQELESISTGTAPYRIAIASFGSCRGDCDGDARVDVGELVSLITIALGDASISGCASGDLDADGKITVDEIIAAVEDALDGCAG